jgi:lactase-phlorizin hydrolase
MFHWDVPQYLQDLGGFASEFIIPHFVEYAKVLFENFGDRVSNLFTRNNLPATLIVQYTCKV